MAESLALFATLAALTIIAVVAAVGYRREKDRRLDILRELQGETVVLGISTGGQARFVSHIRARIVDVQARSSNETVKIDLVDLVGPYVPRQSRFAGSWSKHGVLVQDILSIETPAGIVYRFEVMAAQRY